MTKKLTSSDIYDINRKTGALILGKNRLDDYATKYLTIGAKLTGVNAATSTLLVFYCTVPADSDYTEEEMQS